MGVDITGSLIARVGMLSDGKAVWCTNNLICISICTSCPLFGVEVQLVMVGRVTLKGDSASVTFTIHVLNVASLGQPLTTL
jgi:hypothetical protein